MTRTRAPQSKWFDVVKSAARALPDVEASIRYDGSPVLKMAGCFMAGIASHPSAEPGTLVVRSTVEDREWLVGDAPEAYYVTDHYRPYPVVLVRLSHVDREALRDLLAVSWRLTLPKTRRGSRRKMRDAGDSGERGNFG